MKRLNYLKNYVDHEFLSVGTVSNYHIKKIHYKVILIILVIIVAH